MILGLNIRPLTLELILPDLCYYRWSWIPVPIVLLTVEVCICICFFKKVRGQGNQESLKCISALTEPSEVRDKVPAWSGVKLIERPKLKIRIP
jgi:hypothetical protein